MRISDWSSDVCSSDLANLALFSTLPQRGDLIVADELIHASVHDGIRMSKAAAVFARHNDVQSFADLIVAWRQEGGKGRVWIAVETQLGRASCRERVCQYG